MKEMPINPPLLPPRTQWPEHFPAVVIHANEPRVKPHPDYRAAKAGNSDAAYALIRDTFSLDAVGALRQSIGSRCPVLVSAHALEREGVEKLSLRQP